MRIKDFPDQRSGIALLMTIFVLVLLSMIAMSFTFSTRWSLASTRNFKEETKMYYLAVSEYQEVLGRLLSAKNNVVFSDADGNLYADKEKEPLNRKKEVEDVELEVKVADEGSRININTMNDAQLKILFDYIGIPVDLEQEIIDSTLDWREAGNEPRLSGAKDEYYESLNPPYKAKKKNFDSVGELLLVNGFKPEYLYGSEKIKPLYDLVTVVGDGALNVNTASKELMDLIGLNVVDIETILKQRTKETGGFIQVPNFVTKGFGLKVASNDFRIEVTANVKGSKQVVKIVSVVRRVPSAKGVDFQTVYWRESVESRRG